MTASLPATTTITAVSLAPLAYNNNNNNNRLPHVPADNDKHGDSYMNDVAVVKCPT